MTKGNKQILLLAGAGALAYYFFVHKKAEETSEFSNIGGRRRKKYDEAKSRLEAFCRRHPDSPQCAGLLAGGGGSTGAVAQGNRSGFSNAGGNCKPPLKWCARRGRCISEGASCGIVYKDGKPVGNY